LRKGSGLKRKKNGRKRSGSESKSKGKVVLLKCLQPLNLPEHPSSF